LKISAQISVVLAVILAVICFGVAITGFTSLGEMTDAKQRTDAVGFAWFWAFLGVVATVFGAVGVWMVKTHKDGE
jgi:heme/copper-type cytochrome/quinol oxidase subunit 2